MNRPKLLPIITVFIMFDILVSLGFWQLHRYHYKQQLIEEYKVLTHQLPLQFEKVNSIQPTEFLHVKMKGYYLNGQNILLTNRFHHNHPGYEILTPFKVKNSPEILLVNRGWVPAKLDFKTLPKIPIVNGEQSITGYIKLADTHAFILGDNVLNRGKSPLLIQRINFKELKDIFHENFYPFTLRLNPEQPNGFIRHWEIINMLPERHLSYAIQWFIMAIVLLIAFIAFSFHRD